MTNYYDSHGRIHHKEVTATDPFPSGNSFLFSGEASLVKVPVKHVPILECFKQCSTEFGYNRNPDGDITPLSSHDEIVGLFMLFNQFRPGFKQTLYNKLKAQRFQVCNLPSFKPVPIYKLNPFKVVRDFWRLSREKEPRKATQNYPYIWPIIFRHAPQHTYFYARCAGIIPSFIHSTFMFCAALHTICRGNNSSRVLLGFKLIKLQKLGLTPAERLTKYIYNKRIRFALEVMRYFPKNHPIAIATLSQFGDSVYKGGGI